MKWISVNDKLPEQYKDVLIHNTKDNIVIGYLNGSFWYTCDVYGEVDTSPTHWMPLPEKPQI